jgi:maleylpyruvate isomerase
MVNAGTQPLQNLAVLQRVATVGGDANEWARHFIARGLTALEAASQETEGTFLVGDTPTLADVYLVPQMYNARRWAVDLAPFPTLVRVDATCAALPAFAAAHPDVQSDARRAV